MCKYIFIVAIIEGSIQGYSGNYVHICTVEVRDTSGLPISLYGVREVNTTKKVYFTPYKHIYWNITNENQSERNTNVTPTTPLKDTTISIRERIEIYGLQFLTACIAEFPVAYYFLISSLWYSSQVNGMLEFYTISSTLVSTIDVWVVGILVNQKGSFKNSLIGAGVGTILGIISFRTLFNQGGIVGLFIFPPLGATIGYNWK
jgi:hypothetical protein